MRKGYFFVAFSGILSGLVVFSGAIFEHFGLSLFEMSFIPQLLIFLFLLPFVLFIKKLHPKRGIAFIWILYGFVTAVTIFLQYAAIISGIPVAMVVFLLYLQPIWTILIMKLFFKEKVSLTEIIAGIIVLSGAFVLLNPFGIGQIRDSIGLIFAILAGIFLSCWIILGGIISKKKSHPVTIKFLNAALTFSFLLVSYPLLAYLFKSPTIINFSFEFGQLTWIYVIFYVLFAEIVNHISYFIGVKTIPIIDAGIILLLEPVSAVLLAFFFLSQPLTFNIVIGGILILFGDYLIIKKNR